MIQFTISDAADQQFAAILNNRRVTFRIYYAKAMDRWSFDLSIDDVPVLYGRRIVVGVDLLAPFGFDIGSIFVLEATTGGTPNRRGLPDGLVRMYHATEAEINAAIS